MGPCRTASADRPAGSTVLVNRALIVILATVTLDAVGIGLALPVIPTLLRELSHETRIAGRFGYFMAIYPFMQFLFSTVLGRLSDRFGRRPVLLVSLGVASVDYLIMGLSPLLPVLYLGRALAGDDGRQLGRSHRLHRRHLGPDERARRFGLMNACFGLGFVAGPLLGGLAGSFSARNPFLLAALFSGLNLLMGIFVLPESHRPGSEADQKGRSFVASLLSIREHRTLLPLLTYFPGQPDRPDPWVAVDHQRGGPVRLGRLDGGADLRLVRHPPRGRPGLLHRADDPAIRRAGGDLARGRLRLRGVRRDGTDHEGVDGLRDHDPLHRRRDRLAGVSGSVVPAGSEEHQGELQGTLVSLTSLTEVVGPIAATSIYAASPPSAPGLVWIVGAGLYVLCSRSSSGRWRRRAGSRWRGGSRSIAPVWSSCS